MNERNTAGWKWRLFSHAMTCAWIFALLASTGCGWIADKDRIVVARLDGEAITRGKLKKSLRDMTDEARPMIQNRGDLIRVLSRMLDDTIKSNLAKELRKANKISVPREAAAQIYFRKHEEDLSVFQIQDPAVLGMSPAQLVAKKAAIEFGIDDEEELLLREQAVIFRAREAISAGTLAVTEEDFEQEYELRGSDFISREMIEFMGIRFETSNPEASREAADTRRRVIAGESFKDVAESFRSADPNSVMQSAFENDPASEKFRGFWAEASGCSTGDVLGPVFLPAHEILHELGDGTQADRILMADAHIVLEVLEHRPPAPMTLDEARRGLVPYILTRKMMARLRKERGLEIYEDKLWNPAGFGNQFQNSFIRTN